MLSFPMQITQFTKQEGGGRGQEQKWRKRKANALLAEQARYSQIGNSAFGANLKSKEGKVKKLRQSYGIMPIPMTALSTVWVCGRSLAGIMGLNPDGGMVNVLCCQVEVSAQGRSLVQRSPTECVCVSLCVIRGNNNPLHLQRVGRKTSE